jgi:imidazole glycerol-phosphate synthase subunit HisF
MMTLKTRIITTLLWDGTNCVKPVAFCRPYRKLGPILQYLKVADRRNIDELILIDICATTEERAPLFAEISEITKNCFYPVTIGGGISALYDVAELLRNGADKVAIRTATQIIPTASKKFGAQAIVGVIDYDKTFPLDWVASYAAELEARGCGEILLTDTDYDGRMRGYNLELIDRVTRAVTIPVIASGGCGDPDDMLRAIRHGAHAVAAGSMFLYTDYTPKICAEYLDSEKIPVRLNVNL